MNDPGFGELGDGGNRPSGIYLGFYNKLDLVNRYIDGKDAGRMERMAGSIDPLTATVNQFNPVTILANSIQNVRVASEVYGTDEAYMWEAQVLGAYKGMANALGTAVAAAFSWTGVGIAIGAAIIASGNAIQVDTKTGSRDAVMNDRAAVGTAIGLASMYAGDLTSGANVAAADRLLAAAINTSASSIGAGFSYNDHGNITGWTLSGSNGDAFLQNIGTGALSAGISMGITKGFDIKGGYAQDIISSVSSTGVNTFAEYYKYNQGYQNNYAAMANPDIGNASAFWGLAVTMGGRASRDNSATNTTSDDWSWDNAMSGFAEGFLGEFTGWVGLGSAGMDLFRDLANQTDQGYRAGMSAAGIMRRKEEEAGWVDYYGDDDTLDDRPRSSLSDFDPEYMAQKLVEAMGEPPEGERMGQTPRKDSTGFDPLDFFRGDTAYTDLTWVRRKDGGWEITRPDGQRATLDKDGRLILYFSIADGVTGTNTWQKIEGEYRIIQTVTQDKLTGGNYITHYGWVGKGEWGVVSRQGVFLLGEGVSSPFTQGQIGGTYWSNSPYGNRGAMHYGVDNSQADGYYAPVELQLISVSGGGLSGLDPKSNTETGVYRNALTGEIHYSLSGMIHPFRSHLKYKLLTSTFCLYC